MDGHAFLGHTMQLSTNTVSMIEKILIDNEDITRVVELGTGCGGSSLIFGNIMIERGGKVLTFDVLNSRMTPNWHDLIEEYNITFRQKDVFQPGTVEEAADFIKNDRALIFCDDGHKKQEVPLYAPILKINDLIMAHDWGGEILPEHLDSETMSFLEPYRQEEFDAVNAVTLSLRRFK